METLHGIRFVPFARVRGTLLGLDVRWLGVRGLALMVALALATPAGPLSQDLNVPLWARVAIGLSSVLAVLLTSLGHELGHALAGRMSGLAVRAIVLAPHGGVTIRASSDRPQVNFRTALAGPMANAVLGAVCAALALLAAPNTFLSGWLMLVSALQLLTALANLLPLGALDGSHIAAAWRALSAQVLDAENDGLATAKNGL
jgi:Zn-dependent protease